MLNSINLCGRTTADLELKTTPNGRSVTSFTLAVDRDFTSNGEKETDFISVVAWGSTAEFAAKWFTKGKMMIVSGRLQVRTYTDKEGSKRYVTEVVADKVFFAGDKPKTSDSSGFSANTHDFEEVSAEDETLPF